MFMFEAIGTPLVFLPSSSSCPPGGTFLDRRHKRGDFRLPHQASVMSWSSQWQVFVASCLSRGLPDQSINPSINQKNASPWPYVRPTTCGPWASERCIGRVLTSLGLGLSPAFRYAEAAAFRHSLDSGGSGHGVRGRSLSVLQEL